MFEPTTELNRPFTPNTFQQNVEHFDQLIKNITRNDPDASPDERRQFIAGATYYVTSGSFKAARTT